MSRGSKIIGWASALPDNIVTNADLEKTLDTSDEWIKERTGIHSRRVGGSTVGLSVISANAAIEKAGIDRADIDVVVLATTSPDRQIPASASSIQRELGLNAGAFDINAACSGFVYALVVSDGLIRSGAKNVLLVGTDTLSRYTDWEDRNTAILFGDGTGAMVITASETESNILAWSLESDGDLEHLFYCEEGEKMQMIGKEVFRKAVVSMVSCSQDALKKAGVAAKDVALFVPHQANVRIIEAACKRFGFPMERVAVSLDHTGNTSSASIPIAFDEAEKAGRVKPGDIVLMTGFGAGMTAAAVVRWNP